MRGDIFPGIPEQLRRLGILLVRLDGIDRLFQMAVGLHHVNAAIEIQVVEQQAKSQHGRASAPRRPLPPPRP